MNIENNKLSQLLFFFGRRVQIDELINCKYKLE